MNEIDALSLFDSELASPAGVSDVRQVMRAAVHGEAPLPVREPQTDGQRLIAVHRVGPLFELAFGETEHARGFQQRKKNAISIMGFEAELEPLRRSMQELGVDYRLLKGMATAHVDYARPEHRQFGDVDLLVGQDELLDLEAALKVKGFRRFDYGPGIDPVTMDKGLTLISRAGSEFDIHTRLFKHLKRDSGPLFENPAVTSIGDPCLSAEARLVHAAAHSLITRRKIRRLSSLVDCSVILRRTGVDMILVKQLATDWGVQRFVAVALEAEALLYGDPAEMFAMDPGHNGRFDLLAMAYLAPRRRLTLEYLLHLRQMPVSTWPKFIGGRLKSSEEDSSNPVRAVLQKFLGARRR